ncbi:hypothetical protein ACFYM5_26365 [Streptomyces sp. NPDC006706]|uniref:hypothetical protein n=1 Tax=Streptomyces sp. NPDC006706 TaxID=3364761 RepID=UPI0036A117D0
MTTAPAFCRAELIRFPTFLELLTPKSPLFRRGIEAERHVELRFEGGFRPECRPVSQDQSHRDSLHADYSPQYELLDTGTFHELPPKTIEATRAKGKTTLYRMGPQRDVDSNYGLAIAQMRAEGRAVDDDLLADTSLAHSEKVNFCGTINVEVDTELAKLDQAATGRCGIAVRT